jgi:hypothetical protein
MELALLLLLLVLAELVVSVWMLARHKLYLQRVAKLENNVKKMAEVLADLASEDEQPTTTVDLGGKSVSELVAKATPDDIAQAQEILAKLGVKPMGK